MKERRGEADQHHQAETATSRLLCDAKPHEGRAVMPSRGPTPFAPPQQDPHHSPLCRHQSNRVCMSSPPSFCGSPLAPSCCALDGLRTPARATTESSCRASTTAPASRAVRAPPPVVPHALLSHHPCLSPNIRAFSPLTVPLWSPAPSWRRHLRHQRCPGACPGAQPWRQLDRGWHLRWPRPCRAVVHVHHDQVVARGWHLRRLQPRRGASVASGVDALRRRRVHGLRGRAHRPQRGLHL